MKIDDAKAIPLSLVVETLGARFARKGRRGELWYHSPFRPDERTASFKIDEITNRWHDFGLTNDSRKSGGDIIDLWCDYHNIDRKSGVKDALTDLERFSNSVKSSFSKNTLQVTRLKKEHQPSPTEPRFKILKLHNGLYFDSIKAEVARRKISLPLAAKYLKQVYLSDADKPDRKLNGFAFKNDKGGYEISIPNPHTGKSFKTSTTPKWFTTIPGKDESVACVFEGFWDFLTWMEMEKAVVPPNTAYVLNSVSFAGQFAQKILEEAGTLKTVKLYMDNDNSGRLAAIQIAEALEESGVTIGTMEQKYLGYKDFNEWWIR